MFSDEPVQIFGSSRQQISRGNFASLDINLKHSIELLIQNSVAPNTYQLYGRGFSAFVEFRQKVGLANAHPISLYEISNFIAYLFRNEFSHSTVKNYLEGINRLTPKTRDFRLPVTREILLNLIRVIPVVCNSSFEATLYKAAFSMAFHGLLKK